MARIDPTKKQSDPAKPEQNDKPEALDGASDAKSDQPTEPKAALDRRARIAAAKAEWDALQVDLKKLLAKQDNIETRIAEDLVELDKGRSRGTPPTAVILGSKKFRAQKSRDGGPVSLAPVPEVGESL